MRRQAAISSLFALLAACTGGTFRALDADQGAGGKQDDASDPSIPCDGLDQDGDGRVDESADGDPMARSCATACGSGNEYCEDGRWVCYAPEPQDEVCDNFDNDCDGEIDEECGCRVGDTRECGPTSLGTCRSGVETCQGDGTWAACAGSIGATEETCGNQLDDDCDGQVDETCGCAPGSRQACGDELGECTAGLQTCDDAGSWGACEGMVGPGAESCNGLDDNCDGQVDESWRLDDAEGNDSCDRRVDLGEMGEESDPILWNELSLFSLSDADWFTVHCAESRDFCNPFGSECTYHFTVQVTLDSGIDPTDVEVCAVDGSCADSADPDRVFCTTRGNWSEGDSAYVLDLAWGGGCSEDDSKDFQVVVRSTNDSSCGGYGIALTFRRLDEDCP